MQFLMKRWVQVVILTVLLLLGAGIESADDDTALHLFPFIQRLRDINFDMYNEFCMRDPGDKTAVVDLDEDSLSKYGQWPWRRTLVSQLVTQLKKLGARSITFDVVFAEPDRTSPVQLLNSLPDTPEMVPVAAALRQLPDNDKVFAQAIKDAGNVVLGFVGANQPTAFIPPDSATITYFPDARKNLLGMPYFATNLSVLSAAAAGEGAFIMTPDQDGVIRRVPLFVMPTDPQNKIVGDQGPLPALTMEALRVGLGSHGYQILSRKNENYLISGVRLNDVGGGSGLVVPTDDNGKFFVHYARDADERNMFVPALQVLGYDDAKPDEQARIKSKIDGKIVFIGTSSIGLVDLRSSPIDHIVPGVEVHAEIVNQVLHQDFIERNSYMREGEVAFTIILGMAIILLAPVLGAGWLAALALAGIGAWVGFGWYSYAYHAPRELFDVFFPPIVVMVTLILASILSNLRTEMEKRMIRQAFDRYLSPALIEELVKDPSRLKLGGDVRELSVMFTDIRNFTTISESMDPAELIRMMNDFLTPMTSAVLDNKGFVDKYMGDAMMTFWNAPVDDAYHATNACRAALEMVEALKPVNAELKSRAEAANRPFHELKAGIGINSGKASVGNMGSKQRFAYSALGDTVNLASRMEGQTKVYGVTTMISSTTHELVKGFAAIELDLLTVKGRTEPERVYTLLGDESVAKTETFVKFADVHARMLAAYRAQAWDEAARLAAECAELRPDIGGLYRLYDERINAYRAHPPGEGWSGVWVAKEK